MDANYENLIKRFNAGELSAEEEKQLELAIEQGKIDISQLKSLDQLNQKLVLDRTLNPSEAMTDKFYSRLSEMKRNHNNSLSIWWKNLWGHNPIWQLAYTIGLLVVGFYGGSFLVGSSADDQAIKELSSEVSQMKEMMMLNMLEKESISDRLKAVNLTNELPNAGDKVIKALLKTINEDQNVNVRLAAIEALYPYAEKPEVRMGLINAIGNQKSPLMQVALAEMMVALQEKRSVDELKEIINKEDTPEEVREQISQSIKTLI